jgi:RsiW-degrading membrane proteinase PrsW (M82 family)
MLWFLLAILFVAPLVGFYFIIIRSVDRYAPEPWWLLFVCLMWGALGAVMLASAGNWIGAEALGAVLGRASDDELVGHATATFVAPLIEEPAKALGLLAIFLFSRRRVHETHGPLSGMVYGGIIGLGFTFTEDIDYIVRGANEAGGAGFIGLLFLRTILLGFGHATFTAMTGLGFGLFVVMRSGWRWGMPLLGLAGGMLLHFGRNLFASFLLGEGIGLVFVLLLHALVVGLFFGLLIGLGFRDRGRVMEGLREMVGVLITREEYDRIINPWMLLPGWNIFSLTGLPGGYFAVRAKQLNLFKLAFIRNRFRHERTGSHKPPRIDPVEAEAIAAIQLANQQGIYLAPYPATTPPPVLG